VKQKNVDVALGSLGVRLHTVTNLGIGRRVIPELRGSIQYDFAGNEAEATSTFTGGGAAFASKGAEVAQLGTTVGAGFTLDFGKFNFSVLYDATFKAGYVSHSGAARGALRF